MIVYYARTTIDLNPFQFWGENNHRSFIGCSPDHKTLHKRWCKLHSEVIVSFYPFQLGCDSINKFHSREYRYFNHACLTQFDCKIIYSTEWLDVLYYLIRLVEHSQPHRRPSSRPWLSTVSTIWLNTCKTANYIIRRRQFNMQMYWVGAERETFCNTLNLYISSSNHKKYHFDNFFLYIEDDNILKFSIT